MGRHSAAVRILPLVVAFAACGPDLAEVVDGDDVSPNQGALSTCSKASYAEALTHYQTAVTWSKERLALGVCESRNGFQWEIANEASRAVMTCADFRATIRTSVWAAPLRKVLGPSLTLRSLTGELLVIKPGSFENWTGVDAFFPKGLSFWARAQGAYGPAVRIDFAANGQATWGELVFNQTTGDITWSSMKATYSMTSSKASAPRVVSVTHAGKTVQFALTVQSQAGYRDAPVFVLVPVRSGAAPELLSLVRECDA